MDLDALQVYRSLPQSLPVNSKSLPKRGCKLYTLQEVNFWTQLVENRFYKKFTRGVNNTIVYWGGKLFVYRKFTPKFTPET